MRGRRTNLAHQTEPRIGFGTALRSRTFAVLYGAEAQSIAGDQLARIALSFLVFDRTHSAGYTAAVYALTFLPAILGGVLLARIGDHLPRRAVMVGCDLARAGLFAGMCLPGLPLPGIAVLLAVAVFLGPAFTAAEVSYLADRLDPEVFRAATGLRMVSNQAVQVAGFAVGGVLVAALDPRGALLVNAGTFAVSALLVGVVAGAGRRRPRPAAPQAAAYVPAHAAPDGAPAGRAWWRERRIVGLLALSALQGFFVVPEGLAVPFASHVGASTTATGVLLAAIPLGGVIGAWAVVHLVPDERRGAWSHAMAVGCGLPLLLTAFDPTWPVAGVLWLLSGALAAYQIETMSSLMLEVSDSLRARLVGLGSALLLGAQGIGIAVFGSVASGAGPGTAIAAAGASGSVLAVLIVAGPLRLPSRPAAPVAHRGGPDAEVNGRVDGRVVEGLQPASSRGARADL